MGGGGGTGGREKLKVPASSTLIHVIPMQSWYQMVGNTLSSDHHFNNDLLDPRGRLYLAYSNIPSGEYDHTMQFSLSGNT